jgi:hypothetical protein
MKAEIPFGGGGNVASTSVEVLESPWADGLQAQVQALQSFKDHATAKGVHTTVKDALRTIKPKGTDK